MPRGRSKIHYRRSSFSVHRVFPIDNQCQIGLADVDGWRTNLAGISL